MAVGDRHRRRALAAAAPDPARDGHAGRGRRPDLLDLTGTSATGVRRSAWMIGSMRGHRRRASSSLPSSASTRCSSRCWWCRPSAPPPSAAFRSLPPHLRRRAGRRGRRAAVASATSPTSRPARLPAQRPVLRAVRRRCSCPKGFAVRGGDVRRPAAAGQPPPSRPPGGGSAAPARRRRGGCSSRSWSGARLPVCISGAAFVVVFLSLGLLVQTVGAGVAVPRRLRRRRRRGVQPPRRRRRPALAGGACSARRSSPCRSGRWWPSRPSACPASTWPWPRSGSASCSSGWCTAPSSCSAAGATCSPRPTSAWSALRQGLLLRRRGRGRGWPPLVVRRSSAAGSAGCCGPWPTRPRPWPPRRVGHHRGCSCSAFGLPGRGRPGRCSAPAAGTAGPSGFGAFESLLWLTVIAMAGRRVRAVGDRRLPAGGGADLRPRRPRPTGNRSSSVPPALAALFAGARRLDGLAAQRDRGRRRPRPPQPDAGPAG